MPKGDYAAFRALDPFFSVVMEGLSKFVDGEHYLDTLDDDVLFEFRYDFPGWPQVTRRRRRTQGRRRRYRPWCAHRPWPAHRFRCAQRC